LRSAISRGPAPDESFVSDILWKGSPFSLQVIALRLALARSANDPITIKRDARRRRKRANGARSGINSTKSKASSKRGFHQGNRTISGIHRADQIDVAQHQAG
jgi:hypothetical protein